MWMGKGKVTKGYWPAAVLIGLVAGLALDGVMFFRSYLAALLLLSILAKYGRDRLGAELPTWAFAVALAATLLAHSFVE